jgi:hypothetical protein
MIEKLLVNNSVKIASRFGEGLGVGFGLPEYVGCFLVHSYLELANAYIEQAIMNDVGKMESKPKYPNRLDNAKKNVLESNKYILSIVGDVDKQITKANEIELNIKNKLMIISSEYMLDDAKFVGNLIFETEKMYKIDYQLIELKNILNYNVVDIDCLNEMRRQNENEIVKLKDMKKIKSINKAAIHEFEQFKEKLDLIENLTQEIKICIAAQLRCDGSIAYKNGMLLGGDSAETLIDEAIFKFENSVSIKSDLETCVFLVQAYIQKVEIINSRLQSLRQISNGCGNLPCNITRRIFQIRLIDSKSDLPGNNVSNAIIELEYLKNQLLISINECKKYIENTDISKNYSDRINYFDAYIETAAINAH